MNFLKPLRINLFLIKLILACCFFTSPCFAKHAKKVLVVDQDPKTRENTVKQLEGLNYQVASTNIRDAVLNWLVFQPHVVILDMAIHLGDLYLIDKILLEIKKITPSDTAKVVLTSGRELGFLYRKTIYLIDAVLNTKFNPKASYTTVTNKPSKTGDFNKQITHAELLKKLINQKLPNRAFYLPDLKVIPTTELQTLRESIQTLTFLKQKSGTELKHKPLTESIAKDLKNFRIAENALIMQKIESENKNRANKRSGSYRSYKVRDQQITATQYAINKAVKRIEDFIITPNPREQTKPANTQKTNFITQCISAFRPR